MIDKVEVGKKYRLINKQGFLTGSSPNYNRHLVESGIFDSEDCVVIAEVDDGIGYYRGIPVIHKDEYKYFELIEENKEPKVITPETDERVAEALRTRYN